MTVPGEQYKDFIESGILELYVLGIASTRENYEVKRMISLYPEVQREIEQIRIALSQYSNTVFPDPTIKPFLMAVVDYEERLKNGEQPSFPPELHKESKISDYAEWIGRDDINLPVDFKDFHAKIIGCSPGITTAIVWIKNMAPQEVHDNEFEKFLILEGTCDLTIENEIHHLSPGNFLAIPLHKKHDVKITSSIPCKIILQRIAA